MGRWTRRLTVAGLLTLLTGVVPLSPVDAAPAAPAQQTSQAVRVEVLSNRADLVTGGAVLVEVIRPDGPSDADGNHLVYD